METGQCERVMGGQKEVSARTMASRSVFLSALISCQWISSVSAFLDGRRVVSGSREGTLRVWDIETGQCEQVFDHNWVGPQSIL
jgi:WD40 repeat protein